MATITQQPQENKVNNPTYWLENAESHPIDGGNPSLFGMASASTPAGATTYSVVGATGSYSNTMVQTRYTSNTAATAVCGYRNTALTRRIANNFFFQITFGIPQGGTHSNLRMFAGLADTTAAATDVQPSSIANLIGVGAYNTDSVISVIYGSGATKAKIATPFLKSDGGNARVFMLRMVSTDVATVDVQLTEVVSGVIFKTKINSGLPNVNTAYAGRVYISAGTVAPAQSLVLSVGRFISRAKFLK